LRQTFDLQTRSVYTKVSCEIGITVDGKELPSLEVLGRALEKAIFEVQSTVTESYQEVPERSTPAEPVVPATPVPGAVIVQPAQPAVSTQPVEVPVQPKPPVPFGS